VRETTEQPDTAAGFFGKVTSHGDFVARRLPASFRDPWDAWLQEGIQSSQTALGDRWLATYLSSPIWRFALAPGVCDGNAWAGVLMPSVDRVGRHFPLTLAAGVPGHAPLVDWLVDGSSWFKQLEDLGLSSLQDGFLLDAFDAALALIRPLPGPTVVDAAPLAVRVAIDGIIGISGAMPQVQARMAAAMLPGHGLWWTDGSPLVAPSLLISRGLPARLSYTAMLDGEWQARGWEW
jgi:type VI secretion system protein ImpM